MQRSLVRVVQVLWFRMLKSLRLVAASYVRTNTCSVNGNIFEKRYDPHNLPGFWHSFERKIKSSPLERFSRESCALSFLHDAGVSVPRIVQAFPEVPKLHLEFIPDVHQLRDVLADESVSDDTKLASLEDSFQVLRSIHDKSVVHGDALTKNYLNVDGHMLACDFEHERSYPNNAAFDVRLLAADAVYWLGNDSFPEIKRAMQGGYCSRPGKVNPLRGELLFFKGRFRIDKKFIDFFYHNP